MRRSVAICSFTPTEILDLEQSTWRELTTMTYQGSKLYLRAREARRYKCLPSVHQMQEFFKFIEETLQRHSITLGLGGLFPLAELSRS